ncbi:MAG: sigma-54 dependent transcriptional regulator [Henriciella sp.]
MSIRSGFRILAADHQPSLLRMYTKSLCRHGYHLDCASDLESLNAALSTAAFDVLLLDLSLIKETPHKALSDLAAAYPDMKIIAIDDQSSVAGAVETIKAGCSDYLSRPVSMGTLEEALERLKDIAPSSRKRTIAPSNQNTGPSKFIGHSPVMQRIQILTANFAKSTASVLITGESGTGKEVCASELHRLSARANGPFIPINCAALPSELMESELFGHIKGAFTGASSDRVGAAQAAHGGTLFLDEIGEMDIALQAKLLRFLQTGEVKKVGSDKVLTVDARVVCATNRNLQKLIKEGKFREDLYYRLDVLSIDLPPIRARGNDIIELANHFYDQFIELEGGQGGGLMPSARLALIEYDWPGNVRELQNVIRRGVVLSGGGPLEASDLLGLEDTGCPRHPLDTSGLPRIVSSVPSLKRLIDLDRPFAAIEQEIVEALIELKGGSVPKAAAVLSISPSTLYRKREAWALAAADPFDPGEDTFIEKEVG